MITITLKNEGKTLKQIIFHGHAMYDDYGKDIVLTVLSEDEVTSKLLENMVDLLYELEESYPKNIAIRKRDN